MKLCLVPPTCTKHCPSFALLPFSAAKESLQPFMRQTCPWYHADGLVFNTVVSKQWRKTSNSQSFKVPQLHRSRNEFYKTMVGGANVQPKSGRAVLCQTPFSDGFSHRGCAACAADCGGGETPNKRVLEKLKTRGYPPHKKYEKKRKFCIFLPKGSRGRNAVISIVFAIFAFGIGL